MPLAAGEKLGPYEILAPIGAGGMGEVWKARDHRLNRIVAIKRLKGQHSARFKQEARAVAALNHPHICQIFDVGPDYLVLEYIEGTPLRGPLPAEEAVKLALQVTSALEEAHARGILHRDLKPANILVTPKGTAKLLDFGLAKLTEGSPDSTQTLEGTVMGTAHYMSPEQAQGQPLDERSDIFSFGSVLYEILSGKRAFGGASTLEILNAVVRSNPAPLLAPDAVARVVARCLEESPADRFSSIAEVRAALSATPSPPPGIVPSIAVLPFANLSADPEQEYFSDGLAEEIINALVQVPGLKVIARTSAFAFKGQNTDVRHIAGKLGVAHILEGSVRKAGQRIRITAQLISAADGTHLWSQRYDRDFADVFAVQDEIASAIAEVLRIKLSSGSKAYVPKPEAHEALLKARHLLDKFTQESLKLGHQYLRKATDADPGYGAAHAALANYYWGLIPTYVMSKCEADPLVRAAALRAVQVDPSSPEVHALLCVVAAHFDYDWTEAERQFVLATGETAASSQVRQTCAFYYLLSAGRPAEAVRQMEQALRGDPLNTYVAMQLGLCLQAAGDYEAAFDRYRQALELDQNNWMAHWNLGIWLLERGRYEDARKAFETVHKITPTHVSNLGSRAAALKLCGDSKEAKRLLTQIASHQPWAAAGGFFTHYALIQDFEKAADWAAKAIELGNGEIPFLVQFSYCRGLRASSYWPKIASMLNLP